MTTFERIKKIANERGYNLKETAIKAGLSQNALYRYNQGVEPKYATVKAVADVLGVSVDYLLGNTEEPNQLSQRRIRNELVHGAIDLNEVSDDERDRMISANGQPISDDDWAIIKAVLAKYPKRD